jgi:hypothetical protein
MPALFVVEIHRAGRAGRERAEQQRAAHATVEAKLLHRRAVCELALAARARGRKWRAAVGDRGARLVHRAVDRVLDRTAELILDHGDGHETTQTVAAAAERVIAGAVEREAAGVAVELGDRGARGLDARRAGGRVLHEPDLRDDLEVGRRRDAPGVEIDRALDALVLDRQRLDRLDAREDLDVEAAVRRALIDRRERQASGIVSDPVEVDLDRTAVGIRLTVDAADLGGPAAARRDGERDDAVRRAAASERSDDAGRVGFDEVERRGRHADLAGVRRALRRREATRNRFHSGASPASSAATSNGKKHGGQYDKPVDTGAHHRSPSSRGVTRHASYGQARTAAARPISADM